MQASDWVIFAVPTGISAGALLLAYLSFKDSRKAAKDAGLDAARASARANEATASATRAAVAAERIAVAQAASVELAARVADDRPWLVSAGSGSIQFRLYNNTPEEAFDVRIEAGGPVRGAQRLGLVSARTEVEFDAILATTGGFRGEPFEVTWKRTPSDVMKEHRKLLLPPR